MKKPNIFDYTDYKLLLKELYLYRKSRNKKFTHRYIIDHVQASSSGWFSDLLKGRINLSSIYRFRLSQLFSFTESEDEYFNNLVNYEQASSFEEQKVFFQRILQSKQPEAELVLQHQFDFYRIWYVSAIREILLDYDFDGSDYNKLTKLLKPVITEKEARYAIMLLEECDLIVYHNGKYQPTSRNIKKSTEFSSFYWKAYMEAMLALSEKAIKYPKEIRDISAVSLNLSKADFISAQILIAELRKKLLKLTENTQEEDTKKTYQCNFQLFPISEEF